MIVAMRPVIVAGNWKMNTTPADRARARGRDRRGHRGARRRPRHLPAGRGAARRRGRARRHRRRGRGPGRPRRGRRRVHGRASPPSMVVPAATWAIVGHSERRRDQCETDALIGRKLLRCGEAALRPILCVGELLDEREAGRAEATVREPAAAARSASRSRVGRARSTSSSPTSRCGRSAPGGPRAAPTRRRWPTSSVRPWPSSIPTGRRSRRRCRSSTADRSRAPRSASSSPSPRSTGRSWGARASRSTRWPASSRAPASPLPGAWRPARRVDLRSDASTGAARGRPEAAPDRPDAGTRPRPIVLVIVDGFGIGQRPGRRRDRCGADAALARAARRRGRTGGSTRPVRRSGCRSGRWATARSGTSTSAPAARCSRTCRASTPRSRTAPSPTTACCARPSTAAAGRVARVHLVGLVGPGGVHSTDGHAVAIAALAREAGVEDVVVHALLDGRDTPPRSADGFVRDLEERLARAHPRARIATVAGRYYGMDRDQRWERTQASYDAMVDGVGSVPDAADALAAIEAARERGENDEFVRPTRIGGVDGRVRDGDLVIHFNFRADRARQLTHALVDADFAGFARRPAAPRPTVVTLTEYEEGLPVEVAFPPARRDEPGRGLLRARLAPVPRRRDREVRARHVLPQRRRRGALARRGAAARAEPEGRDL